jgi:hypothetical protein
VSLWQVAAPVIFCSVLLSCVCLILNAEVSPRSHFARRQMLRELGEEDPLALLDEGRFVNDFPGVQVYVGKKSAGRIEDITIIPVRREGGEGAGAGGIGGDPVRCGHAHHGDRAEQGAADGVRQGRSGGHREGARA